jgi:hypothetical protein
MPEPWEVVVIVLLAYAGAVYLRYMQWLSDDSYFHDADGNPDYVPFRMWD